MANKTGAFRLRAFISFLLLFSALLSALSGVLLFVRPEGSLAAWTGWSALGMDKKGWEGLHAVFVLVLVFSAAIHLFYNWGALAAYFRFRKQGNATAGTGLGPWRELTAAALLALLILAGCLGKWLPVRWIVDLRGMFKNGAAVMETPPPAPDADQLTLDELGRLLGISQAQFMAAAARNGVRVAGPGQTLADVARRNGLSPEKVFNLIRDK